MTERPKVNRPINPHEVRVIRTALERAAKVVLPKHVCENIEHLRVIEKCACGCDSVTFVPPDQDHLSRPLADALGTTPAGGEVGIIVWGCEGGITGLEVYDMGAGEDDIRLPVLESIRGWEPTTS